MRWPGIPKVDCSRPTRCSKSCDLYQGSGDQGYCLVKGGGNAESIESTVSDAIAVAGCGQLQLGAAHWATSVALL